MVWPLVVDGIGKEMRLAWEEPFGPVLPFMRISDPREGVAHCNESRLALQVGNWGGARRGELILVGYSWGAVFSFRARIPCVRLMVSLVWERTTLWLTRCR